MKKFFATAIISAVLSFPPAPGFTQCAMCTKTAQQLGEKPARGLNSGILYLMLAPFTIIGFIGFRWWKNEQAQREA